MTPPVPVDVIYPTEEALDPEHGESNISDNSASIRRGERIGLWTHAVVSYLTYNINDNHPPRLYW